jgi:hypothetical protein
VATFSPPLAYDVPRVLPETRGVPYRLMRHFSNLPRGRSVVRVGSTYQTVDNPAEPLGTEGVDFFLGGHVYVVTDTVGLALVAAGYTVTDIVLPSGSNPGFSEGGFGDGYFGS